MAHSRGLSLGALKFTGSLGEEVDMEECCDNEPQLGVERDGSASSVQTAVGGTAAGSGARRSRHARNVSCPAALGLLHTSNSSTSLAPMDEGEEAEAPTPPAWSPALQASVAAWQSATSLLQELQLLQPEGAAGGAPPPLLLTPEQALPGQQPAWLQALLAQPSACCEATSDCRPASDGAVPIRA